MQDFSPLHSACSSGRLAPYRISPVDSDKDVASRYLWNIALCESLYPSLQFVEVTLRNAIHEEMSGKFGTRFWFEDPAIVRPYTLGMALKTRTDLEGEAIKRAALNHRGTLLPPAPPCLLDGQMVADANFGFWVSFFYTDYFQGGSRVWSGNALGRVFPGAPATQLRPKILRALFERIRRFRNRTMHHEPLWNRPGLLMTHSEVIRTIGWLNPEACALAKAMDRFPTVHQAGAIQFHPILDQVFPDLGSTAP